MAHRHDHDHAEEMNSYLIEQIFTVGLCGAIAAVTISLYVQNKLGVILVKNLHLPVLLGGIALLAMVVIRALALWNVAGQLKPAHDHEHDQDHAGHSHDHACCGHDHAHEHKHSEAIATATPRTASLAVIAPPALAASGHSHAPDHDECCQHEHAHQAPVPAQPVAHAQPHSHGPGHDDHDHGAAFWRYVLLLLPVALFFLNLPNKGHSAGAAVDVSNLDRSKEVVDKGKENWEVGFVTLEQAAMTPDSRTIWEGVTVRLIGSYVPIDDERFTLTRYKMNCCAADAVAIKAVIVLDASQVKDPRLAQLDSAKLRGKWVCVTGKVQFLRRGNTNEFQTALVVTPTKDTPLGQVVEKVPMPADPYAGAK